MKEQIFKRLLFFFILAARILIWLRYRIRVKGLDQLTPEKLNRPGGILFLPNHPAEVDPVMILTVIRKFKPRPLVIEHFYYLKSLQIFMDIIRALPVPNLYGVTNKWKVAEVEKMKKKVEDQLRVGENFMIYPAGRLKSKPEEAIGGASFVYHLINECPEANIVLIRTRGLWGSLFSRAGTGSTPDFGEVIFKGMKIILKNLIFFTPRREIEIEIAVNPSDFPFTTSRLEMNRYLENWYNQESDEIKLVSFYFWKHEVAPVFVPEPAKDLSQVVIPKVVEEVVLEEVGKLAMLPPQQIDKELSLAQDLGFDSLDMAELSTFIEGRYGISDLNPSQVKTVQDLLLVAAGIYEKEEKHEEVPAAAAQWVKEGSPRSIVAPEGKTIQEAFLRSCARLKGHLACADGLSGILTYRKVRLAALVLSQKIRPLPGQYVGILLPSSVGASVVILATLLAGKVPVMLNWTAGRRSLDHSLVLTGLQTVLSSYRFLSRLEVVDLGNVEEKLLFLEEVRRAISLKEKLKALWWSLHSVESLLKTLELDAIKEEDPAVVLFTSGTETLPKGVSLTHKNILSNQGSAVDCFKFLPSESLYGVLPPFHSFGFSVTTLLPLLSGVRVIYSPDPTNTRAMASDLEAWKPSLFCCAPSFISALFRRAHPEQLMSLRLIVSAAEKTPQELFDFVAKLGSGKQLLEGYGITECSPIVSVQRPNTPHKGVGKPIPGVEVCAIHPETLELLPPGKEGELCIAGPNVFGGYLGEPDRHPFLELQGKRWYRSGDLGFLDEEGNIILSGRLKRFVKIGGEMVGLTGLETELLRIAKEKNWPQPAAEGPALAVVAREKESDKPLIILFTTFEISKEAVNEALKECGYGRIVKVAEVKQIAQIPLTGTGKTHYRLLDELS